MYDIHSATTAKSAGDRILRLLIGMAATVIVVGGMRAAAPLLTQVLMIAFATIVLSPAYYALRRLRFPAWLAIASIVLGVTGICLWALVYVLPPALLEFSKKLPAYHSELVDAAHDLEKWLRDSDIPVPSGYLTGIVSVDSTALAKLGKTSLSLAGTMLKNGVVILVVVGFMLAELPHLPAMVRRGKWATPERISLMRRFAGDVRRYMAIKTAISAATGLVVYGSFRVMGVDSPVLLGVLAFCLNYVPAIGSVLAAIPGVLLALGSGGVGIAGVAAVIYLAVNQILGNIIEPRVMGAGFGVSPVVVLLSAVFWSWVLGPVGMLLAVPLTMAVRGTLLTMQADGTPPPPRQPAE